MPSPENPFQPPKADPAAPTLPRPLAVRFACQLLLASVALSLATLIPGIRVEPLLEPGDSVLILVVIYGTLIGLSLLLIAKTHEGQNWARWTNLVYLALGWWLTAQDFNSHFQASPVAGVLEAFSMLLEMAANGLLFTGIGRYWFKQMSDLRRAAG